MITKISKIGGFVRLFFVFLMLFSLQVFAGNYSVNVYSQKTVTAGLTYSMLIPPNQNREYLLIQNNGSVNVTVAFCQALVPTYPGILIPPGGNYEPIKAEKDGICMSAGTAGQSVLVVEGQ